MNLRGMWRAMHPRERVEYICGWVLLVGGYVLLFVLPRVVARGWFDR